MPLRSMADANRSGSSPLWSHAANLGGISWFDVNGNSVDWNSQYSRREIKNKIADLEL
jgi:hypothetical protein